MGKTTKLTFPIYRGLAAADSQINTAFSPQQRRDMPKFY